MGQTLSEPNTSKKTMVCENSQFKVGSSQMQGWRISMEDAHTHLLSLPYNTKASFFGVYDGHGGSRVSEYAAANLHNYIANKSYYQGNIIEAIREGFLSFDYEIQKVSSIKNEMSGSTAVIVLVQDSRIYCGNAGDSRAVLSVKGKAIPMSFDHKPTNDVEIHRIHAAGGWVEYNRVNGNLALSRALGDFAFKCNEDKSPVEQIVTANPDVEVFEISTDSEFFVIACDGIWDVLTNQEVVSFCRERLLMGIKPEMICEELLDYCLAPDCDLTGAGCDNMTVILACLLQNETFQKYRERVASNSNEELPAELPADEIFALSANSSSFGSLSGPLASLQIPRPTDEFSFDIAMAELLPDGTETASKMDSDFSTVELADDVFFTPKESPDKESNNGSPDSEIFYPAEESPSLSNNDKN